MNKKKLIIVAIVVLIVICLILFFCVNKNKEDDYNNYIPQEEISEEQFMQTMVVLHFAEKGTYDLKSEARLVNANLLIENPYKQLVKLLIDGPKNSKLDRLIPENTVIYDAYLEKNCVTLNLSHEFLNYKDAKFSVINSIVNTLTQLKEVDAVRFLIDGKPNENLNETYVKI